MNLVRIDHEIREFRDRIVKTLKLQKIENGMLPDQKKLSAWVHSESNRLKAFREDQKKNTGGILTAVMNKFRSEQKPLQEELQTDLHNLRDHIQRGFIPKDFTLQSNGVSSDIVKTIEGMKGKKWENYYGYVRGPFLEDMFLMKKQDFHNSIEKVCVNHLKFIMIEEKSAHLYQRNLVQEIFGRIFRPNGSLSVVLKIQVQSDPLEPSYNIFCYVQDNIFKKDSSWSPISQLKTKDNRLFVEKDSKELEVCPLNMLEIILSEIMVVPLQSLVSDFIVRVDEDQKVEVVKCNEQDQEQIIKEVSLKEHPSLRNPLFYFKSYMRDHPIKIKQAQKVTINHDLYSSFYKALSIIIDLTLTDFSTKVQEKQLNSSICFNFHVFSALWDTFHKIILLSSWMKQVMEPLKDSITLSEVIAHFCPIFNEIVINDIVTFKQYQEFYLNVQIESYLATVIRKKTIEKYKDMFVNVDQAIITQKFSSSIEIYERMFKPILEEADINYVNPTEVTYILNFACKYKFEYVPQVKRIPEKWLNKKIWYKCLEAMRGKDMLFIDIGFDILAYACGIDTYSKDPQSFERIKFMPETASTMEAVQRFIQFLRDNYDIQCSKLILSSLLEKSFKHKKFAFCKKLLDERVRIRDFKDIIKLQQLITPLNEQLKQQILTTIQQQSPQMHRLFEWEELMLIQLQKSGKKVQTIHYGQCLIPETVFQTNIINNTVINNISRKDYKFDCNREIAVINQEGVKPFYIEQTQYPLVKYFYQIFFTKLGVPEIMPYFTSFFHNNRFYHLVEHLPNAVNYQKGLSTFSESQLNLLTDDQLISEAIILSMVLLPGQVEFKDIVICQPKIKTTRDLIFVVDWKEFYHKDFMNKSGDKVNLNCKNSLFLLDLMNKSISPEVIKKYADLDVLSLAEQIFQETKKMSDRIYSLQQKHANDEQLPSSQVLSMIFESGFAFNMTERLFIIKRAFKKKNGYERNLSYNGLLELLHKETSYLYGEITSSDNNLLKREAHLFNDNWKRPFVSYMNIIDFFGSFCPLEEVQFQFPQHYYKFCFQGPTESMASALKHIKKFTAFSSFLGSLPPLLEQYNNQSFEYFMKYVDLSEMNLTDREKFLQTIKSKSRAHIDTKQIRILPLSFIRFKNLEMLKDKYLHEFSFERVEELVIQSCRLGEYEINNFPKSIENILSLTLKDITGLKYIGSNTLFGNPIEIKHLKRLSILGCQELISVDLKCDILESFALRNNLNLQNFYIYSMHLKNIYVYNNPKINLQNIGLYILKGINVLLCKNSCHGDIMRLYSESYFDYTARIMKYFLLRFFNAESRYIILLTLSKMKEVDDNLFAMVGISSIKPISSVFNKFSSELEDRILSELARIYFENPHIQTIATGIITQSLQATSKSGLSIERIFKLMDEGLLKAKNIKSKKQVRFERPNYQISKTMMENLKRHFDRTKIDKYFTIVIDELIIDSEKEKEEALRVSKAAQKGVQVRKSSELKSKLILAKKQSLNKLNELSKEIMSKAITTNMEINKNKISNNPLKKSQSIENEQEQKKMLPDFLETNLTESMTKIKKYEDPDKVYALVIDIVRFLGIYKEEIQRMSMIIKNSVLRIDFLEKMFEQVQIQGGMEQLKCRKNISSLSIDNQLEQDIFSAWKINRLSLEYTIIESFAEEEEQRKIEESSKTIESFKSIKALKLKKCVLPSFDIIKNFNSLKQLHLADITISTNEESPKLDGLFDILHEKRHQLNTLQLEGFFTEKPESQKYLQNLWDLLDQMSCLVKLSLNNSIFSRQNLNKLNSYISKAKIKQLALLKIKVFTSNEVEEIQSLFKDFLVSTEDLKILSIELQESKDLQSFIEAISNNTSVIDFKIYTPREIASKTLAPLNKNLTLQSIHSNAQLPIWLLNHIKSNSIRKSKMYIFDNEELKPLDSNREVIDMALNSSSRFNSDYYRMGLSLDGGGVRGMLLATELNYLAKQVGYPLHKIFDCVGGTSIGGILALASTGTLDGHHPVADTDQLMEIFSRYGKDIFKKSQYRQLLNLFDTKYSAVYLESVLKNYFKDCRLSSCLEETNVVVTAVNRADNKDYIFRSMEALLNRDKDFYMRDVGRATSAAPTFFPSAQIKNIDATLKLSLVDGGVGLNNPSKLVIDEIKKISANSGSANNYFLVSLGTGRLPQEIIPEYAGLKDLSPIIDSFTESAAHFIERDLSTNYKGHFFRVSPIINVENKKDAELDSTTDQVIQIYRQTGLESAKKSFKNTVLFGKYRNMNLIEWLRENTARKEDI